MTATKQRIIYLGTPQFAVKPVFALLRAGYQIPLVITQPPRPQGRKGQVTATPVQRVAEDARLPFLAVPNVNQPEVLAQIEQLALEQDIPLFRPAQPEEALYHLVILLPQT